ncbi:MAG TPA: tetratricopeptide repeat protein, partial [Pyrinomonadaceae bacterium]
KIEPASAEVHLSLGLTYMRLEKDKEALKSFKEAVKLNPDLAEAQYGLGIASFRLSRFRDASDAFKKATKLEPNMAKAHYGLALTYQELGEQSLLVQELRTLETLDRNLAKKLTQAFPQMTSCRFSQCR